MSEYGAMKPLQRAQLKQKDPKRFERVKTEHERQEAVLMSQLKAAKNYEEYKAVRAELEIFDAGGDPWAEKPKGAA